MSLIQFTPVASLLPGAIPLAPPAASAASNPIQVENSQPGTTSWQIDTDPNTGNPLLAQNHEIEGYASLTSVNVGDSISFMVSLSTQASYTMNIYRMGYYAGAGGRLMLSVPAANGTTQASCPRVTTTTNFGLTECAWTPSYTLSVPSNWTTGDYIVKLKRLDSGLESYIPFTVRNDGAPADIVLSNDVTTWQAYNFWGGSGNNNIGYSLYGEFYDNGDNNFNNIGNTRAYAVSFNRPYAVAGETDGAGQFFIWDYPMVRWLESQGYNVTYATDIDIDNNATLLAGRKAFINTGHDEYYSANMRSNLQGYINGGAHAGFFSANNIFYQIRFANDAAGNSDRTIVCYKNSSLDPNTIQWRYLNPPQPENAIIGVMQNGVVNDRPWVVYDASSWIFAGTGLTNGQNIPSLVGYEFDERAANDSSLSSFVPYEPAGLQQVAHSPVPASDNGVAAYSDATLYTASSGAIVFAAGTMQWSWGLDAGYASPGCGGCNHYAPSANAQRITTNILNKFLGTNPTPTPAVGLNPSTLTFGSQPVGTTSAAQAVTLSNAGSAALTISSISITGTNGSDFAQTNTCPISPSTLAAGASCTINVTFTPSASGSRSASVTISDNAPGSPHHVGLSGTGTSTTSPVASLSPATLSFGSQAINTTTAAQAVTLSNTGNAVLTISSIGFSGNNPGDFAQTNTCGSSLAAGSSCTINVTFTPTTSGARSANLSVADNAAGSPHTAALTGTGTLPAGQYLADGFESGSLSAWGVFNGGGTTATTTAVVNSGSYAAALTNAANGQYAGIYADLVGGPQAQAYTRFCFQVPASGSTTVLAQGRNANGVALWEVDYDQARHGLDIYFWNTASTPTRYDLYSTANLITQGNWYCAEVFANEATSGQGQVWLNGSSLGSVTGDLSTATPYSRLVLFNNAYIGNAYFDDVLVSSSYSDPVGAGAAPLPIPAVSLAPSSLSFGNQTINTASAAQTVTLTNSGNAALTITSIGFSGTNASDFAQTNTCPSSLAVGANCTISVTFSPAAAGNRAASLSITDNAGGSPHTVALTGTGVAPGVNINPTSLAFGTQQNGAPSAAQSVTVTNNGAAPLTITSIGFTGSNPGDFAQTNTCPSSPSTLAVNASCTINVTFVPTASGARSASLTINDNAPNSPQSVALSGSGSPAGQYLVDGFESGSTGAWTIFNGGGAATVETTTVNSGSNAAALTNTAGGQIAGLYADLAGGAQSLSYSRFCFDLHGIGNTIVLAQGRDVNGVNRWEVDYDFGRQGLDVYFWNGAGTRFDLYSNANLLTADTWYCAEVFANEATSGQGQVWLNGTNLGSVTGDLSASTPYSRLYLWNNAAVGTVNVDDVAVSNSYNGPVGAGAASLNVPVASLNPTSLTFGNQATNTASTAQTVTLTNSGQGSLAITSIGFSGSNPGDFAQTNTCPSTLTGGASCTISVTFTPTAAGSRAASLSIVDNASGSPHTVALTGTGTAATVAISPASLSFGTQPNGTPSAAQSVTLTNSGAAPLTISSIGFTGTNPGDFAQTNTCPASPSTLAAGANCTISVTFTPAASGSRSASLTITDNAADSPQSVALSGSGSTTGQYLNDGFESGSLSAWTVFNGGGSATVQTTTVNGGSHAAALTNTAGGQIAGIYADLAGGAETQSYTRFCFNLHGIGNTIVLAQGRDVNGVNRWEVDYDFGRQGLDVYFWNGAGTRFDLYSNANVLTADTWYCAELQANEASSGQGQVWLNGTSLGTVTGDLSASTPYSRLYLFNNTAVGTVNVDDVIVSNSYNGPAGLAAIALNPASLAFGNQTVGYASSARSVTLTNTSAAALTINGISVAGANAGDFAQTTTCPASPSTLAAGANCTISVTFTPTATGNRSASLSLATSFAATPASIPLSGSGVPPAPTVSLSPTSLSFSNQQLRTTSSAQSVTLTNTGTAPLTISSITLAGSNAGDFAQTNTCPVSPSTLAANANCTISVTFKPTAAGSRAASISIADNAAGSPQSLTLSGTGAAPAVSLSPASLTFSSLPVGTTSAAQSVTLSNTGSAPLTISSLALTGANASDFAQTNTCPVTPSTLAANASCTISVTFSPTATGTRSAAVSIADNAAGSPQSVALSGTGGPAGQYLTDGFESGSLSAWTVFNGGGTATVQSATVNTGTNAVALTNASSGQLAGIYADLAGGPETQSYTRFCFNLHGIGASIVLAQGRDVNGANRWEIDYDYGHNGLDAYFWSGTGTRLSLANSNNVVKADAWYCAQLQINEATSGQGQLWLNGTSLGTVTGDLSASTPYSRLYLWNNAAVGTVNVDDVAVTNSFSAPVGAAAAPSNLTAKAAGSNINLSWTVNSTNQTGFAIWRSTDGTNFTLLTSSVAATATSYTDNSPVSKTTNYYRIQATGASSSFSNTASATAK